MVMRVGGGQFEIASHSDGSLTHASDAMDGIRVKAIMPIGPQMAPWTRCLIWLKDHAEPNNSQA
ncbi:hypothetical protein T265_08564 [Opisthorchis viverrini]|uniref:Uncharacterized protein n=1 Tax=Opisthorchis viverrini TaxID=6198 RepID=A0A074ZD42_OPIVI|nr:hypothetical protein T265_08564 [Opisthorchis viverrini]KER23572.1 hypothetical protein T265_08564 [Opisthorchis viverrini]